MDVERLVRQYENPDTDLYVLAEWLRNRKLEVDFSEHWSAQEVHILQYFDSDVPDFTMSTHQLRVTGPFGVISVIRGRASLGDYEIYDTTSELFDGIRRYREVEHAGKTIYELLTKGMLDESVPTVFCILEALGSDSYISDPLQEFIE